MQAQVNPCGHARGRENVAVVDEEAVRQHVDLRMAALQLISQPPVGCGASSVEQPSCGERERAGADRHEARTAGVRGPERVENRCRHCGVDVLVAGDDHRLGAFESFESGCRVDGEPGACDWCRPALCTDRQSVARVAAEDLRRGAEFEWEHSGQREHRDSMGPSLPHGPIIAIMGLQATVALPTISLRSSR